MDEDYLSFSGVDGAAGRSPLPPMPLCSFAQAILGKTFARDSARRARAHRELAVLDFGVIFSGTRGSRPGWLCDDHRGENPPDVLEPDTVAPVRESQSMTRYYLTA